MADVEEPHADRLPSTSVPASLPDADVFGMSGLSSLTCTGCSGEGFWRALVYFVLEPKESTMKGSSSAPGAESIPTRPLLYLDLSDVNIAAKTLPQFVNAVHDRNRLSYRAYGGAGSRTAFCFALQELSLAGIDHLTDVSWMSGSHFFLGGSSRTLVMPRHHLTGDAVHNNLVDFLSARPPMLDSGAQQVGVGESAAGTDHREDEGSVTRPAAPLRQGGRVASSGSRPRMWLLHARGNLATDDRLLHPLLTAGITAQRIRVAGTDTTQAVSKRFATVVTR